MSVHVAWDRSPVSVHSSDPTILEGLILHLRNNHNLRSRSIVMKDREQGGFVFFLYQACDPAWILEFTESQINSQEE